MFSGTKRKMPHQGQLAEDCPAWPTRQRLPLPLSFLPAAKQSPEITGEDAGILIPLRPAAISARPL